MVVYVEYVLVENFLLDGMLLYLSLRATRVRPRRKSLFFSALCGSVFALLFPLAALPDYLKLPFGFLLVLLCFPWKKGQNGWGKLFSVLAWFFALSFLFGGVLTALHGVFSFALTPVFTLCGFFVLSLISIGLIRKLYQKRAISKYLYDCVILAEDRRKSVLGYLDSGNLALKGDTPVCFLSPEVFYELFVEKREGQVFDEMKITTVSGEKRVRIFKGRIAVEKAEKEVYFSLSPNMLSREYKVLLNARIFE
ncbi:MAG: sigma-E processing peptidase SpoIIGA [Clostridia bacterium]|nr:sigma-E processing peptidase SpoIIGA [Clostridia bacterium]